MSTPSVLAVLDPAVGVTLLASGALTWWLRPSSRTGPLAVLSGVCWFAGALIPSLALLHRGPLVQLLVTHPSGRATHRVTRAAVLLGWLVAVAAAAGISGVWLALVPAALLFAVAVVRARHRAGLAHHLVTPAIVAMLAFASILTVAGVNLLLDLDVDLAVAVTYDMVVILVVVGLCATLVRAPWTEDTLADLVTDLGRAQDTRPSLEGQLRQILGDPALTIGYWSDDRSGYLDENGRPLEDAALGRASTVVTDRGRPAALLVHDTTLGENPALLDGATAAVRLAVGNAAMRRDARARVARLAKARHRMVEVADAERLALSRRLDQGPLARLRRIGHLLEIVGNDSCADPETVGAVRNELDLAQQELYALAHGVRPTALTEGGLGTALPALAAGCPAPTTVSLDVGRIAPATEAALYFVCAEALANAAKHAHASLVRVTVRTDQATVVAEIVDNGVGGADPGGSGLRGLRDRIEALGGTFEVGTVTPHGVRLAARVPVDAKEAS